MSEVASGAIQGAMAGSSLGPPGMIVGAILGGVFGGKARKARKEAQKAQKIQSQMEAVQNTAMRRQQVREFYISRAQSIAAGGAEEGGLESSTVLGAVGSTESQFAYNTRYFDTQLNFQAQYANYARRSQKLQGQADLGMQFLQLAGAAGGAYMRGAGRNPWQEFRERQLTGVTPTVKYTHLSPNENFGAGMRSGLGSRKAGPTLGDPGKLIGATGY